MKKFKHGILYFFITVSVCIYLTSLNAQGLHDKALADSLLNEFLKTKSDTDKVKLLIRASKALTSTDPSTAMSYADSAMHLSQRYPWKKGVGMAYLSKAKIYIATSDFITSLENAGKAYEISSSINLKPAMADALSITANNYQSLGNYSKAIEDNFKALSIYEEAGLTANIAWIYNNIGSNYYWLGNYSKAIDNYNKALILQRKVNDKYGIASALDNLAGVYQELNELEKANKYNLEAIKLFQEINDQPALGRIYFNRGNFLQRQKNFDSAIIFYKKAIAIAQKLGVKRTLAFGTGGIGELYFNVAKDGSREYIIPDSFKISKARLVQKAHDYFTTAFQLSKEAGELSLMMQYSKSLSETEALRNNYKASLSFYKDYTLFKDSIFNDDNKTKIAALENERLAEVKNKEIQLLNKENALQKSEQEKKDVESKRIKNQQYFVIAALAIIVLAVVVIALIQYRHNKQKQKANSILQHEKEKVESTLSELKSTQAQLIQSEKMASLGELTAGIAHEIQNPLNFVNNFSEVSNEMLDEMKTELATGNLRQATEIADDIKQNLEKINHHGKRADAIVKGMLQHSRASTGKEEATDINALADEYLRLSYHGMRAKDKGFNAEIKTDFDERIGKINVVPQDIGRVLLNLFNNAFYSIGERRRVEGEGYEPLVSVCTKRVDSKVEIQVKDNGTGIPQKVVDKIFQPFFTTKPAGQGTGLGLSLSYDIIKAHGGEIKVETKEGEGSEFIIQLPV